jgi:hypothetical protein
MLLVVWRSPRRKPHDAAPRTEPDPGSSVRDLTSLCSRSVSRSWRSIFSKSDYGSAAAAGVS